MVGNRNNTLKLAVIFLVTAGLILSLWLNVACRSGAGTRAASDLAAAQLPGTSSGAGATLVGPTNASQQTTQVAKRRTGYYPQPTPQWPLPMTGLKAPPTEQTVAPSTVPAWIDEQVTTTLSPHQDAAAIVKVAEEANRWTKVRWIGIFLVVAGAFGLAWSHNNPDGYPLICWKVLGIGAALALIDPSPWWLLLLLIPAGFYAAQKLKLINLPSLL